jgi:hypothetical protein
MSAADRRVGELLDRWLASIELHARYLELDDAAYAKVQDWPKHQRPTKWVVELARARLLELKRHLQDRESKADAAFAESLELMSFLTTLLGSEHIERFIPQAVARPAASPGDSDAAEAPPQAAPPPASAKPSAPAKAAGPAKAATPAKPLAAPKSTGDTTTRQVVALRQKTGKTSTPPQGQGQGGSPRATAASPRINEKTTATVIADAVRFLSWGREWPQLASSIARLADRPAEPDVLRILREHRAAIEAQARRPPD